MAYIAVVEDDPAVQQFVSRALTSAGHEVVTFSDVRSAIISPDLQRADVIVADLVMDPPGQQLIRFVEGWVDAPPVIAMSGYVKKEDWAVINEPVVTEFLSKPFEGKELIDSIEEALIANPPVARPELDPALLEASQRVRMAAVNMLGVDDLPGVLAAFFRELSPLQIETPAVTVFYVDPLTDEVSSHCAFAHPRLLGYDVDLQLVDGAVQIGGTVVSSGPLATNVEAWLQGDLGDEGGSAEARETYVSRQRSTCQDRIRSAGDLIELQAGDDRQWTQTWHGDWEVSYLPFRYGVIGYREREHDAAHDDMVAELALGLDLAFQRYADYREDERG